MKRFFLIALVPACGAPEPPPVVRDPAAAVAVAPVEAPPERPDFPGVITSRRSQLITAEFQGRLEKVLVHSRKRVKTGEVIARLDPSEMKMEAAKLLAQEQSSGAQAGAYAASARAAAQQAKTEEILYKRGYQSRNATISARARLGEAQGQIGAAAEQAKAARVQRQLIEEQIKKAELPAPIDGIITILKGKEGEVLAKGVPVARVFDDSDLMIKFAVPREYRSQIKEGLRVELRVAGVAEPIWANIERITDAEPPITFSVVEADIDDAHLRPGEIQVATEGRVQIAEAPAAQAGAKR